MPRRNKSPKPIGVAHIGDMKPETWPQLSPVNKERMHSTLQSLQREISWKDMMSQHEKMEWHAAFAVLRDKMFGELGTGASTEDRQAANIMFMLVLQCNEDVFAQATWQMRYERLLSLTLKYLLETHCTNGDTISELRGLVQDCVGQIVVQEAFTEEVSSRWFGGRNVLFQDARSSLATGRRYADKFLESLATLDSTPTTWQSVRERYEPAGRGKAEKIASSVIETYGLVRKAAIQ